MKSMPRACSPAPRPRHATPGPANCADCSVRNFAVCSVLDAVESAELERLAATITLEPNAVLARTGQPTRNVYSVTEGMLRLVRALPDGRRLITGFSLPGDFIGLSEATFYRHSIEAVTASRVCVFDLHGLHALGRRFPKLEHKLLERACLELDATHDAMLILARLSPLERLASFLLRIGRQLRKYTRPGGGSEVISLPMGRHDIADHLGLTVETVSRSFTRLREMQLIALPEPQWVEICDVGELTRLACGTAGIEQEGRHALAGEAA